MNISRLAGGRFVYLLSLGVVLAGLAFVFFMTGVTMYVRWYINQNFTFLGGWEMEALTLAVFALLMVLLRISERTNNKLSKDIGAALGHPEVD